MRHYMHQRLEGFVAEQAQRGYSKWKVFLKDGRFVGRAGLAYFDETEEVELGYSFKQIYWGQGLATECAQAIVSWAFANTALTHLIAFAIPENLASRRVLEKLGMKYRGTRLLKGVPQAFYRLDKNEFS